MIAVLFFRLDRGYLKIVALFTGQIGGFRGILNTVDIFKSKVAHSYLLLEVPLMPIGFFRMGKVVLIEKANVAGFANKGVDVLLEFKKTLYNFVMLLQPIPGWKGKIIQGSIDKNGKTHAIIVILTATAYLKLGGGANVSCRPNVKSRALSWISPW